MASFHIFSTLQSLWYRYFCLIWNIFTSLRQFLVLFISQTLPSWNWDETTGSHIHGTGKAYSVLYVFSLLCSPLELASRALSKFWSTAGFEQYWRPDHALVAAWCFFFMRFMFHNFLRPLLLAWDWERVLGVRGTQVGRNTWCKKSSVFRRDFQLFYFLLTPLSTSSLLRSKLNERENVLTIMQQSRFVKLEGKSQKRRWNCFDKTVSRVGTPSPFSFCRCK